jgi:hypothetical protein
VPNDTIASNVTSTLRLPNMSPRRPAIGVAIAALRRKPVTVQLVATGDACNERWIAGSAGITSDCISEYVSAALARTASSARSARA